MVSVRFFRDFGMLKVMEKQNLCFLRLRAEEIRAFIMGMLFGLRGGSAITPRAANIYLTDPRQKVEGDFGLYNDGFPDKLVPGIFPIAVLLALSTNGEP